MLKRSVVLARMGNIKRQNITTLHSAQKDTVPLTYIALEGEWLCGSLEKWLT